MALCGPEEAIGEAMNLVGALQYCNLFAEAQTFAREQLGVSRRKHGSDHYITISFVQNLSTALMNNPAKSRDDVREAIALLVGIKLWGC